MGPRSQVTPTVGQLWGFPTWQEGTNHLEFSVYLSCLCTVLGAGDAIKSNCYVSSESQTAWVPP